MGGETRALVVQPLSVGRERNHTSPLCYCSPGHVGPAILVRSGLDFFLRLLLFVAPKTSTPEPTTEPGTVGMGVGVR